MKTLSLIDDGVHTFQTLHEFAWNGDTVPTPFGNAAFLTDNPGRSSARLHSRLKIRNPGNPRHHNVRTWSSNRPESVFPTADSCPFESGAKYIYRVQDRFGGGYVGYEAEANNCQFGKLDHRRPCNGEVNYLHCVPEKLLRLLDPDGQPWTFALTPSFPHHRLYTGEGEFEFKIKRQSGSMHELSVDNNYLPKSVFDSDDSLDYTVDRHQIYDGSALFAERLVPVGYSLTGSNERKEIQHLSQRSEVPEKRLWKRLYQGA